MIKIFGENIRVNPHDLGFGNWFLGMAAKIWAMKGKTDKLDFSKIKTFCASKDTIQEMKR